MRQQRDFAASYCEEFEAGPSEDRPAEQPGAPEPVASGATVQGLCGNCLNRETCQLAGCDGGIWHCEEYQ